MPDFAVNISMLFTEEPMISRFDAAADAGFSKVEIQFPYELSIEEITEQLKRNQQQLVLINTPAGNWAAGERGIACHPDRVEEFREGVQQAVRYATALDCRQVNVLAGITPQSCPHSEAEETYIRNLYYAASELDKYGIRLLSEAINTQDIPGFFLNTSNQAWTLFERVEHANLKLQYDLYHMQIMEGNLIQTLTDHLDKIGHIQFADVPGRHEPQTGELNFPNIFKAIDDMGYSGTVSLEYTPATTTLAGLRWLET
jgi:hydroxypyruvate isomerase